MQNKKFEKRICRIESCKYLERTDHVVCRCYDSHSFRENVGEYYGLPSLPVYFHYALGARHVPQQTSGSLLHLHLSFHARKYSHV